MSMISVPLIPKDPCGMLFVVAIGRISTVHQDIENIEASYRYVQQYLAQIYQGPLQIKLLGEQASGMLTDRATIREAEALVAGGKVDLVIAEDLARIYRNPRHQYNFVQDCVDIGTRVICVGDNLDTADENWEITMGAAALRHGLHIPDTRRRVRRTATYSFHQGGMVQKIRYGYRKLTEEEALSGQFGSKDLRIAKIPECTPIIREMMQRVLAGNRYAAITAWLNGEGIEAGPYVVGRRWTARVVVELLDDPILSGTRTFRDTICRPIFKTGKHKPAKNAEPETEYYPELAHLGREEHAALREAIARRKAEYALPQRRSRKRLGIPRKRSFWPGQAATCAICGGLLYYAGKHLVCQNAKQRSSAHCCWNHVQVPVQLTRERLVSWFMGDSTVAQQFQPVFVDFIHKQVERASTVANRAERERAREIANLERQAVNLTNAIAAGGQLQALVEKLKAVEAALQQARVAIQKEPLLPGSDDDLSAAPPQAECMKDRLLDLMASSYDFADVLRSIFPVFVVQPVQDLDCGLIRPRAELVFRPSALSGIADNRSQEGMDSEGMRIVLDLFEPPQHLRWLRPCLDAKACHPAWSLKKIADNLNINHMTVKRAFDYHRLMMQAGAEDPYRRVRECPQTAPRWRYR